MGDTRQGNGAVLTEEAGHRTSAERRDSSASKAPRFGLLLGLLALLAFVVRENYVLTTIVDVPIRGDIREYVACAWNLVQHGIFSSALPPQAPVADSFRFPGYPWLIALGMKLFPQDPSWASIGAWYPFVTQTQVLLGTATCVLVALLGRNWLSANWSITAGLLLALWPHHIAATDTMLSEVLFGFSLVAALYALARAWRTNRWGWHATAGLAFGYAYLINPLTLLFPPALALWLLRRRRRAILFLAVFLVPVVAMSFRNAALDSATGRSSAHRATLNLVQGSWPNYHAAANHPTDPAAVAIMQEIGAETTALQENPGAGIVRIWRRMASAPAFHAEWYLTKPWLLWGWRIRMGATDVSVLPAEHSPLVRNRILRTIVAIFRIANPFLTTIALACSLALLVSGLRSGTRLGLPVFATAALSMYLTFVHVILQAEPRYATAYRGIESVMIATALAWGMEAAARWRMGLRATASLHASRDNP